MITGNDFNFIFRNFLFDIWNEMVQLVIDEKTGSSADISFTKMEEISISFYEHFKYSPVPVNKYPNSTISILFYDSSFIPIPYFFYHLAKLNNSLDFSSIFSKAYSWDKLLYELFDLLQNSRSNLNYIDIKILKVLSNHKTNELFSSSKFNNQKSFFLRPRSIANIIKFSYKWTSERIAFLQNNYILKQFYIPNPYSMHLKTLLLIYKHKFDVVFNELNEITLIKLRLDFHKSMRIIQIPKNQILNRKLIPFPIEILPVNEIHIFNNLSDLHADERYSFQNIPSFNYENISINNPSIIFKDNYLNMFGEQISIFNDYPSLNKMNFVKRNSTILKVLNYFSKWGAPLTSLREISRELQIHQKELVDICNFLFNNEILSFFPKFTRIGCVNRFAFLVFNKIKNQSDKMKLLYYNLLLIPHSYIFQGKNLLFAYLMLPDTYVPRFLSYISLMKDIFEIKFSSFNFLSNWLKYSIQLPERTTIDEFGIYFPFNVSDSIKNSFTTQFYY